MEKEIWKSVPSLDGFLQVSNLGNVRVYVIALVNNKEQVYINQVLNKYSDQFNKSIKIAYKKNAMILSRLIAETFLENFTEKMAVLFFDGNNENLIPSNLKLLSKGDTSPKGDANYQAKIKNKDVLDICLKVLKGVKAKDIANEYGIHEVSISRITRKDIWKHVNRPYFSIREINKSESKQDLIDEFNKLIKNN